MDNDLMARRLRPPSQQSSLDGQPTQFESAPWDLPPTADGQVAPPDPNLRADVPWDRPEPEPWPPAEPDSWPTTDDGAQLEAAPPAWPAGAAGDANVPADATPRWQPADPPSGGFTPSWDYPVPDAKPTDTTAGGPAWDRPSMPASPEPDLAADQPHDPYDELAPVVSDVALPPAQAAWSSWNGNGQHAPDPESAWVAAQHHGSADWDDGPEAARPDPPSVPAVSATGSGGASVGREPVPDWPAQDDLSVGAQSSRGPVMPEDSWPIEAASTPEAVAVPEPIAASEQPAVPAPSAFADSPAAVEPTAVSQSPAAPEPPVASEPPAAPEPPAAAAAVPQPEVAPAPAMQATVIPQPGAQPMVLRIEVALVDDTRRASPADAARRVGPEADVRQPDFEPRRRAGRPHLPEPEYVWDAGSEPEAPAPRPTPQPRRAAPQPDDQSRAAAPRRVSPPPNAWQPAPPPSTEPMAMDWDLPPLAPTSPEPPAPWAAPAPTWAMTEPTPPFAPATPPTPAAPAYQPAPYLPVEQQPAWPAPALPYQPGAPGNDPLAGLPAVQFVPPAPYAPGAPLSQTNPAPSAPAASSRARTGRAAAAQGDLWFLSSQPPTATTTEEEAQPEATSSSILTAGLTVGFAILVIVLVLVFIQLMTSLLR